MTGRFECAPWAPASSRSTPRRTSGALSSRRTRRGRCTRSAFATGEPTVELERWADWVGAAASARTRTPYQVGWCSWYQYFHAVTEHDIRANLAAPNDWPIDVFQLDDGFQSEIGDWLDRKDTFPGSLDALARDIDAAGFVPGIWIAPFIASPARGSRNRTLIGFRTTRAGASWSGS